MMLYLMIFMVIALVAVLPIWPYNKKWDTLPAMGIGLVVLGLGIMWYMGKL
ncbi:MAG: DUF3309 family protein [Phycisphaeraceae bacterium]|nr:DUF3309 family protein [Phycisphaeraceae bacterium]